MESDSPSPKKSRKTRSKRQSLSTDSCEDRKKTNRNTSKKTHRKNKHSYKQPSSDSEEDKRLENYYDTEKSFSEQIGVKTRSQFRNYQKEKGSYLSRSTRSGVAVLEKNGLCSLDNYKGRHH